MLNYELLLKGGNVRDPSSGLTGVIDVAISGGRIAAVGPNIPAEDAVRVIYLSENDIVTPGLIDLHAHASWGITRHGCHPDEIGIYVGVTTVVDAGSTGSHTFLGFRLHVARQVKTRLLCFLNLSFYGQARMPELRSLEELDPDLTHEVIRQNRDIIRGAKIRAVKPAVETIGPTLVDLAHEVLGELPLMVHIGDHGESPLADEVTLEMVSRLRPNDIITHVYTPYPGRLLRDGEPAPELREAKERGVVLDVARGRMNFSFDVAIRLMEHGFLPDTLSTDLTVMNRHFMVYCLTDVMSLFLSLGCPLDQVILMTTHRPAQVLGLDHEIGSLRPGHRADVSVLRRVTGEFEFLAQPDQRFVGSQALYPTMCIREGAVHPAAPPRGSVGDRAKQMDDRPLPSVLQR